MYTIKDLSEGRVAVINDGGLKDLQNLLNLAFPRDRSVIGGTSKFYFKMTKCDDEWDFDQDTELPTQSVKDFPSQLEEPFNPKRGDRVLVSFDNNIWVERIYLCSVKGARESNICVKLETHNAFMNGDEFETSCWRYIKPLPKEEPIVKTELTMQQIADKFGIEVDNLQIVK